MKNKKPKKKTIIQVLGGRPLKTLEQALNQTYKVREHISAPRKGRTRPVIKGRIDTPQILIGHKVKLFVVK